MQRILLLIAVLITTVTTSTAQNANTKTSSDSILIIKKFGGYQFYKNDRQLNMNQLQAVLEVNNEAYKDIKSARSATTFSSILGYAGGFLIGWPIGTAMGGGKPNWTMAAVGAGLTAISIPISISAKKKARSAVSKYNSGLTSNSSAGFKELKLKLTDDGIGVVLKF
jgi:hypothetical protein